MGLFDRKPLIAGGNILIGPLCDLSELAGAFKGGDKRTPPSRKAGRADFKDDSVGMDMVFVKGGTFKMGCTDGQKGVDAYEKPVHKVTVSDFYIGRYLVTQEQWVYIMGENPSLFRGRKLPVEQVGWDAVCEFIEQLNSRTGEAYRLPTEAEWEYAARGGSRGKKYRYPGGNDIGEVAWYIVNSGDEILPEERLIGINNLGDCIPLLQANKNRTHDVGTKKPNTLGLFDMTGNVCQLVSDWYGPYESGKQKNPTGPSSGSSRVCRGGCWYSTAGMCRISSRGETIGDKGGYELGFRLALSAAGGR